MGRLIAVVVRHVVFARLTADEEMLVSLGDGAVVVVVVVVVASFSRTSLEQRGKE